MCEFLFNPLYVFKIFFLGLSPIWFGFFHYWKCIKPNKKKLCFTKEAAYFEDRVTFNNLQAQQYDHLDIHPLYSDKEKRNMIVFAFELM